MERMSSLEQAAEDKRRWSTELQQRQWAATMAVLEGGGLDRASPEPAEPPAGPEESPRGGEVKLQIGNADLESLNVIEDIAEHRRITITASRVSASVPNLMAPPHLLSRLNPAKLFRKRAAVSAEPAKNAPSHRQILFDVSCAIRPGEVLALMGACAWDPCAAACEGRL